jgi:thiol-disulfide isomerase/thioredoxin
MRNLLIIIMAFAGLFSCAKPVGFVIKGQIKGKESGEIKLMKYSEGKWITEDSAMIEKGKFELKGKTDLPEMRLISMSPLMTPQTIVAQFFAENGTLTVNADADSLNKTEVKGSKSNDDFSILTKELMNIARETQILQQKYSTAQQSGNEDGMKKAQIDYQAMMGNQKVYSRNFIREHPKSAVSPLIALMQFGQEMTARDIDTLVAFLDPLVRPSIYVAELKKMADKMRITSEGGMAPDFTQNTPEGTPLTLSSLRGKIVMIDFWASWCKPCRQENPNVVVLYNKYKDKGFDILGVSLDKEKGAWIKAIADDKLTWHHVSDLKFWQNEAAVKYGIQSIPATLLLDKDGKIIAKNLRGEELAKKLAELLP